MEPSSASPSWASSQTAISTDSSDRSAARSPDADAEADAESAAKSGAELVAVTTSVVDAIVESTTDPLNRFYRYPAARGLLPILGRLPITPNHVTYTHILFGLGAAAIVAFTANPLWLILSFVLCETRMILDCFDGVLARARGSSSPFGRALDEIADTIALITMTIAMTHRLAGGKLNVFVACAMLAFGGLCANAWDFYKRQITVALRDGKDGIHEEIRQKKELIAKGNAGFLAYWGVYFDSFQVWLYDVRPVDGFTTVQIIRARASDSSFRRFAALLAMLSFDNGLAILHIGVLTAYFVQSEWFAMAYAIVLWSSTMIFARRVLRSAPALRKGAS